MEFDRRCCDEYIICFARPMGGLQALHVAVSNFFAVRSATVSKSTSAATSETDASEKATSKCPTSMRGCLDCILRPAAQTRVARMEKKTQLIGLFVNLCCGRSSREFSSDFRDFRADNIFFTTYARNHSSRGYRVPRNYLTGFVNIHRVSKNVPHLSCHNFDIHEWISIFFFVEMLPIKLAIKRRFTMPPQITCASALPGKTEKHENHVFTELDCAVFLKVKVVICDVFDSV